jgi:hypothetical protein
MDGCVAGRFAASWQSVQPSGPGVLHVIDFGAPPIGKWHATVHVVGAASVRRTRTPPAVVVPRGKTFGTVKP